VNWALDGHGIRMRAEWDVARYLRRGRLVQVLPDYQTRDADNYAVYPQRHPINTRMRAFVDVIARSFAITDTRRWRHEFQSLTGLAGYRSFNKGGLAPFGRGG
jgi:hypothetical protein